MKQFWKRMIPLSCAVMVLFAWLPSIGFAQENSLNTVYVSNLIGIINGAGSENAPFRDMETAFEAVEDEGRIVIVDGYIGDKAVTVPQKTITVCGNTQDAFWRQEDILRVEGTLLLDNLRYETSSQDTEKRMIFVEGNRLETTNTVRTDTERFGYLPSVFVGGGKEKLAWALLKGGCFETLRLGGAWGANVTLDEKASVKEVQTEETENTRTDGIWLTISNKQQFDKPLSNIDRLRVSNGKVETPSLQNVKVLNIKDGRLYLSTAETTVLDTLTISNAWNVSWNRLELHGDLQTNHIYGYNASCTINEEFGGVIRTKKEIDPDEELIVDFWYDDGGDEMASLQREDTEDGEIIWRKVSEANRYLYYLDGVNGDDAADGRSAITARKTLDKVYELMEEDCRGRAKIIVCGDVEVNQPLTTEYSTNTIMTGRDIDGTNYGATMTWKTDMEMKNTTVANLRLRMEDDANIIINAFEYATLGKGLEISGEPDICFKRIEGALYVMSGSYGTIRRIDADVPYHVESVILSGGEFESVDDISQAFVQPYRFDDRITIHGDVSTDIFEVQNFAGRLEVGGNIHATMSKFIGDNIDISLESGKQFLMEEKMDAENANIQLEIRKNQGEVQEGTYIFAKSIQGEVKLSGMPGYRMEKEGTEEIGMSYVLCKDAEQMEFAAVEKESDYQIDVDVEQYSGFFSLIAAVYNETGCMTGVTVREIPGRGHYRMSIPRVNDSAEASVFLLDGYDRVTPQKKGQRRIPITPGWQ
jgi:hypothetical protein